MEEDYELPEQSSPAPALPPPRPVKSKPLPPQDDSPPIVPPPRSSKPQPPPPTPPASAPPVQDKDAGDLPPPPPPGEIELEDYEPLETFQEPQVPAPVLPPVPAAVPVRPPKRKVSPPSNDALPPKPRKCSFHISVTFPYLPQVLIYLYACVQVRVPLRCSLFKHFLNISCNMLPENIIFDVWLNVCPSLGRKNRGCSSPWEKKEGKEEE